MHDQLMNYLTTFKLIPAGKLFQIYPRDYDEASSFIGLQSEKYIGAFVLPQEYDRLILSTTMFSDHVPLLYQKVINSLVPIAGHSCAEIRSDPPSARLSDEAISFSEVEQFLSEINCQ